jgi:ankyrin repeat protein
VNAPPCMNKHYTALHYAAGRDDVDCVKYLLKAGARVNQLQQCRGMTLLEACTAMADDEDIYFGSAAIFKLLLNSGQILTVRTIEQDVVNGIQR